MSFSRVKPGGWGTKDDLTSSQLNQLDTNASKAVDGAVGGTYEPGAPIDVDGDGGGDGYGMRVENLQVDNLNATNLDVSSQQVNTGEEIKWNDGLLPQLNARTLTYIQPKMRISDINGISDQWDFVDGYWRQTDTSSAGFLLIPVTILPARGTIKTVRVKVDATLISRGGFDLTVPTIKLWQDDGSTSWSQVGNAGDDSVSLVEYETRHNIEIPGLNETVNPEFNAYYVSVAGEFGNDAVNDALAVVMVALDVEVTQIGP